MADNEAPAPPPVADPAKPQKKRSPKLGMGRRWGGWNVLVFLFLWHLVLAIYIYICIFCVFLVVFLVVFR